VAEHTNNTVLMCDLGLLKKNYFANGRMQWKNYLHKVILTFNICL